MKYYDFKKAERLIQMKAGQLQSASLGIEEDWFWTAESVFSDSRITVEFDKITEVAGIRGSSWATPVLYLEYKDGREEFVPCYTGESSETNPNWSLGCLSGPAQEWVESVKRPKLTN